MTQGTAGAGAFLQGVAELSTLAGVLGLLEGAAREVKPVDAQLKAQVESLVNRRQEARKRRDFAEADRLRNEITRLGVVMEDTPGGTTWKLR
jgi:cysteinyl-tRNA synthetase